METYLKDLRWGRFNLIKGDMISTIATHYGEWSDVEVAIFRLLLTEEANVIEVGANIGMHAVPIAKTIPHGKLLCFEPQRIIFQQLCCNLALNNLTNVETYRMGVSNESGKKWIETSDYSQPWNYGSFSLDKGFSTEGNFVGMISQEEVDIIKLDEFAPAWRLNSLSLLKIDAEGFDIAVLQGAEQLIKQFQPFIFIEINPLSFENTFAELQRQNYHAYWAFSERYQSDNFYGAERFEQGADYNLLCISNAVWDSLKTEQNRTEQNRTEQYSLFSSLTKVISLDQIKNGEVLYLTKR